MKVVINSEDGGFCLSVKAIKLYTKLKGIEVYPVSSLRGSTGFHFRKATSTDRPDFILCVTKPLNEDGTLSKDARYFHPGLIERNDPLLVQVVEQLGPAADGKYAKLKIVEIPDNIKWFVATEEETGIEMVVEEHRTWS